MGYAALVVLSCVSLLVLFGLAAYGLLCLCERKFTRWLTK